jgi:hypothetical protein
VAPWRTWRLGKIIERQAMSENRMERRNLTQISLDEFEHIVATSGCRTISADRRYRPRVNARAVTYSCTLQDFLRAPTYLCRFLDHSERRVVSYDTPDARPILLRSFVLRRDLTDEMLTRWQRLGRYVTAVSSAKLLVFTCTGCHRSLIADGNHRMVSLITARRFDVIVPVAELEGSQWPADMPDMSIVCGCPSRSMEPEVLTQTSRTT